MSCPSLSDRDKNALRNKGITTATVVASNNDEEELAQLARLHGYDDSLDGDQHLDTQASAQDYQVEQTHEMITSVNYISPVPSQILTLYQQDKVVHLDLDSGSWVSYVKYDYAKEMGWKIFPNDQLAKLADNQTVLKSVGEIHETLTRNNWSVNFHALVLPNLHTNVIGGNNFMKENNVEQKITSKNIIIHGKYTVPETNRNVSLPTHVNNIIVPTQLNTVILPEQSVIVTVPFPDNITIAVESRANNKLSSWPTPQICTVREGTIEIENNSTEPLRPGKSLHQLQIRSIEEKEITKPEPGYKYETKPQDKVSFADQIKINKDVLNEQQYNKLQHYIESNIDAFNKDLSQGYNHYSGKHFCKLNWAGKQRPSSKKVICPSYNSHLNSLLQDVCDELKCKCSRHPTE